MPSLPPHRQGANTHQFTPSSAPDKPPPNCQPKSLDINLIKIKKTHKHYLSLNNQKHRKQKQHKTILSGTKKQKN